MSRSDDYFSGLLSQNFVHNEHYSRYRRCNRSITFLLIKAMMGHRLPTEGPGATDYYPFR